ncbi:MAG: glycosyltransferase family 39 protein [Thermoleophilaceae bacterium]
MSTPSTASTLAARALALPFVERLPLRAAASIAALGALIVASLVVRSRAIAAGFWIDEGLSVGIASFPLSEIPEILRQDGSPPLYYALLHVWMSIAGRQEEATHLLSLFFALLAVPAALWSGWSLFEPRVGWFAAGLAALNPFLTVHAQETRMYALMVLLSILATTAFAHAFVFGRRRYLPLFAGLFTLMLYTHNWALFYGFGAVLAVGFCMRQRTDRRRVAVDALLVFGAAGLLYAPWVPTLIFQVLHTGAPWSNAPPPNAPLSRIASILGGDKPALVLLLGAGAGLAALVERGRRDDERRSAVISLMIVGAATLVVAWLVSQVAPAYTTRYLAVVVGPLLLLAASGLARSGRLGLVAALIVAFYWTGQPNLESKSNTRNVVSEVKWMLEPGDLVISTHPERMAVLDYYLPAGFSYASPLGPDTNPGVMDWRDSLAKLKAARPERTLDPLLSKLPEGQRVLLVRPVIGNRSDWAAPWTRLVRKRSAQWGRALERDPRFVRRAAAPVSGRTSQHGIRALVYTKVAPPSSAPPMRAAVRN